MTCFDSYIICTSPRSGSTLLCRMLQQVGKAGCPDSHFHDPSLDKWLKYYDLRADAFECRADMLRAVFSAAQQKGRGDGEIFGLRLQRGSFDFLMRQLAQIHPTSDTDMDRLEQTFGRTLFIHLTRQNKLDQAISVVKAQQSGLWHKDPDGTELERLSKGRELTFDAAAIATELAGFVEAGNAWEAWFEAQLIEPLCITYDALAANPRMQLARIIGALGVAYHPAEEFPLPVAKLSDAINRDWADRFRAERPGTIF